MAEMYHNPPILLQCVVLNSLNTGIMRLLHIFYKSFGLGRILWINDLSGGIWMALGEMAWGGVGSTVLVQDRDRWRALVKAGMNLRAG
jgi:hypothetical protein